MPIARVTDVNAAARTAAAIIQGGSGTASPPNIKLTDRCSPNNGDWVLIVYDGAEYYAIDTIQPETEAANAEREEQEVVPGDQTIGDPNGANVTVRKGGLISMMADAATGFLANKINGLIQLMGRMFSVDTTFFHGRVRTQEDGTNSKVEVSIFGSPLTSPISTEIVNAILDTKLATMGVDINAIRELNFKFNIAPQTGIVTGPNLNFEVATPAGKAVFRVNGTTGIIEAESPTAIKMTGQLIFLNSDGSPLDRVLTAKDLCCYTGNMHGQGSGKVYVGP